MPSIAGAGLARVAPLDLDRQANHNPILRAHPRSSRATTVSWRQATLCPHHILTSLDGSLAASAKLRRVYATG